MNSARALNCFEHGIVEPPGVDMLYMQIWSHCAANALKLYVEFAHLLDAPQFQAIVLGCEEAANMSYWCTSLNSSTAF